MWYREGMHVEKRNRDIYMQRKAGNTLESLSRQFGLSRERIRQICDRQGKSHANELYRVLKFKYTFLLPKGSIAPAHAYRYVLIRWRNQGRGGTPTVAFFLSIPEDEIRSARHIGKRTAEYMLTVQTTIRVQRASRTSFNDERLQNRV